MKASFPVNRASLRARVSSNHYRSTRCLHQLHLFYRYQPKHQGQSNCKNGNQIVALHTESPCLLSTTSLPNMQLRLASAQPYSPGGPQASMPLQAFTPIKSKYGNPTIRSASAAADSIFAGRGNMGPPPRSGCWFCQFTNLAEDRGMCPECGRLTAPY
jgi:hypothetical protein